MTTPDQQSLVTRHAVVAVLGLLAAVAGLLLAAAAQARAAAPRKVYCTPSHHPSGCVPVPKEAVRPKKSAQQPGRSSSLFPDRANAGGVGGGPGDHSGAAVDWALSQRKVSRWAWYCERFVEEAYGEQGKFGTAAIAQRALRLHPGPITSAPAGALVFFAPDAANRGHGHVGLSLGGGRMISALASVRVTNVAKSAYWRSLYRGWASAPASWRGRIPLPPGPDLEDSGRRLRITAPAANQTLGGTVDLSATADGASGVTFYGYYATDPADAGTRGWHPLGRGAEVGSRWVLNWDTTRIPDQDNAPWGTVNVVAVLVDESGQETGTRDFRRFGIANSGTAGAAAAPGPGTASSPTAITAAQNGASSVTVTWKAPLSNGGHDITGYRVARDGIDARGAGPWSKLTDPTSRQWLFEQLVPGASYTFSVQAVNSAGYGAPATVAVKLDGSLSAPTTVSATPTSTTGEVVLSWQPPASAGGLPIAGYHVRRDNIDAGGGPPWGKDLPADARQWAFEKLVPGRTYTFWVYAMTSAGNGPEAQVAQAAN